MSTQGSTKQIDISLESVFASRKNQNKGAAPIGIVPSTFQVSAKIDEESRKDNKLTVSFLMTLADPKNMVTFEFRGSCVVTGTPQDFDQLMETGKAAGSRLPKLLDHLYQRLYPTVFVLAGFTGSSYPQTTTLMAEAISGQIGQVAPEAEAQEAKAPDAKTHAEADKAPDAETKHATAKAKPAAVTKTKMAKAKQVAEPVEAEPKIQPEAKPAAEAEAKDTEPKAPEVDLKSPAKASAA